MKAHKAIKAQSTLELTLSLIVIVMLLAGMIRLFLWGTQSIIGRQQEGAEYQESNVSLVP